MRTSDVSSGAALPLASSDASEPPSAVRSGALHQEEPRLACILARGIAKAYSSGGLSTPVLRGVDLEIPSGSFAALIGPSGCGKTTLLNLVGALDIPDDGELTVCGVKLSSATPTEITRFRRRTVGFIFQACNLLPTLTAHENVELALELLRMSRRERRDRSREMLSLVGLERAADRFPAQLSGGEQQRVAIARALAKAPALVVADEPTGSLDQANGREVIRLMKHLNVQHGTSFLIVTHDPEIARAAPLVLRMEDGLVIHDAGRVPPLGGGAQG